MDCIQDLIDLGLDEDFIRKVGTANSLSSKVRSITKALRSENVGAALGSIAAFENHLRGLESASVDTGFAEALIEVIHSGITQFLIDTGDPIGRKLQTTLNEFLVASPLAKPTQFGIRACPEFKTELEKFRPKKGKMVKTLKGKMLLGRKLVTVVVLFGPDGADNPAGDGFNAEEVEFPFPTLNDTVVIALAGDAGDATSPVPPGEKGDNGGVGGDVTIELGDRCTVAAYCGNGGNGSQGGSGTPGAPPGLPASPDGRVGGEGGRGGEIFINMKDDAIVCLFGGNGGMGGKGGINTAPDPPAIPVPEAGCGGEAAEGGNIVMDIGSLLQGTQSTAAPGNGGKGGDGGDANITTKADGGDGGPGKNGGDLIRNSGAAFDVIPNGEGKDGAGKLGEGGEPGIGANGGKDGAKGSNGKDGELKP